MQLDKLAAYIIAEALNDVDNAEKYTIYGNNVFVKNNHDDTGDSKIGMVIISEKQSEINVFYRPVGEADASGDNIVEINIAVNIKKSL